MYYFDWAATTPISQEALNIYNEYSLKFFGNPSSGHSFGIAAAQELNKIREKVAELLKTDKNNIFFTSGGTESNSIVLNSLLNSPTAGEILVSAIEHPAISEYKKFFLSKNWKFTQISCPDGYINCNKLKEALNPNVKMVLVMAVNNVTGTVQNLPEIVKIIREYSEQTGKKIHIHSDAVQVGGKTEFYPALIDVDSASFSAHKFYGPRGIGILYNKSKSVLPISKGGGQENGLRPGTENLPAIVAMAYALEQELSNLKTNNAYILSQRKKIEDMLIGNGFSLISPSSYSTSVFSPYILCLSADKIPSEVFLRLMSEKGFALSATSACSANSKAKAENVLSAMNIRPELRMSAIRISLSHLNSEQDVNDLICAMIQTRQELYGK